MSNAICDVCRDFLVKETAVYMYTIKFKRIDWSGTIKRPICEGCRLHIRDMSENGFDGVEILSKDIMKLSDYDPSL